MYDIIDAFINHDWISTTSGEQGYILAIACIVLVVFVVKVIDLVSDVFHAFIK